MNRDKGFTLIEMLVSMAIFTALITTLMLGFQQGLLLWDKSQKQSHDWLKNEFRYSLLSSLFSQAVIADNQYKQGLFASYFIGTATNIKFISAAPIMDINGKVHPIEIQAIQDKGTQWTLRYREGARYSDLDRGIKWGDQWINLLTELKIIKFTYLAPAFPLPEELDPRWLDDEEKLRYRDKPTWVAHYDSRQRWRYPVQIEIELVDNQDIKHQWLFTPPNASDAWSMGFYYAE
jgi:prepilin-type N-terminal cleavage/methylation domain-containing protein